MQISVALRTPFFAQRMEDVSTVLEKGTPGASVLLGKEVNRVNRKVSQNKTEMRARQKALKVDWMRRKPPCKSFQKMLKRFKK